MHEVEHADKSNDGHGCLIGFSTDIPISFYRTFFRKGRPNFIANDHVHLETNIG